MNAQTAQILLDRVARALRGLGLGVTREDHAAADDAVPPVTWLQLERDRCRLGYAVAVKRRVTMATVGAVVMQLRPPGSAGQPRPLLVTDHIAPPVAEALRRHEQPFADAAGNAYLESEGFLISVTGQKLREKQTTVRANREFSAGRLKVLFALFRHPELAASPYRMIAATAGVALGAMPTVIAELLEEGSLLRSSGQRRLAASRRLLDEWAQAYALALRGRTLTARYRAPTIDNWREWALASGSLRWGGEPAAVALGCTLVPGVLTIYGDKLPARLISSAQLAAAGPLDYERLVELRKPFWGPSPGGLESPEVVPATLVYADLLATGSARCVDAAQMIYDTALAEAFPTT